MPETIKVAAAVLRDDEGRVLVSRRRAGQHLEGMWEFPAGKVESGDWARARARAFGAFGVAGVRAFGWR